MDHVELRGVSHEDDDRHDVETAPDRIFQDLETIQEEASDGHQGNVCVISPEEFQSDQPTLVPIDKGLVESAKYMTQYLRNGIGRGGR